MIRINLLASPKPKSKRGSAAAAAPSLEFGEVGSPKVKILLALVLFAGWNANYKRRVDVIDQLRNAQAGPSNLLNTLGDTVNGTEAVWLSSMKDQGGNIAIQGMALSTDAVANLIQNLQKSGFKNVEIKETYQDEQVKDMQAFQFELTCQKPDEKGKS